MLCLLAIVTKICECGRGRNKGRRRGKQKEQQRGGMVPMEGRRRQNHVLGPSRTSPRFSQETVPWYSTLFGGDSSYSFSSGSTTFQWMFENPETSSNDDTLFQSGLSHSSSENNAPRSTANPSNEVTASAPWRGRGSFTGDIRLDCFDRKCTKGAVQVFNRESKTWGNICGDRWTKKESQVVCNFLQFSKGARKPLRVKSKKISAASKLLPTMYKEMQCRGSEASILECRGEEVDTSNPCDSDRFAGVVCTGKVVLNTAEPTCTPSQVLCGNRQKCIEMEYLCDGMSDCPWGTDEENCEGMTNSCPTNQFWCGSSGGGCIRNSYRCDGDRDCANGNDEENCEDHLSHFRKKTNRKMRFLRGRYNSGWRNVSPYLCAKKCREESSFHCKSFDYDKASRACDMSSFDQSSNTILLRRQQGWDHYEISVPADCDGFLCGDFCLASSRVCDGITDCVDATDEASCDVDEDDESSVQLRLSGGITRYDGRVEIKVSTGDFGLICDIGWTINEANVACRQLGFRNGALITMPGLIFHRTTLHFKMSGVSCNGDEAALTDCRHDPWNMVTCPRDHEAGVVCQTNTDTTQSPSVPPSTTLRSTVQVTPTPTAASTQRPSSQTCGVKPSNSINSIRPRIVGGSNAAAHEWPWQVGIWLPWQLLCGGTLIGDCWVLTAAHCFTRSMPLDRYTVRLGDHQTKVQEETEQDFKIERIISHSYNTRTHDNDIALLKLKRKNGQCARLNAVVRLACLPTTTTQFVEGKKCYIIGWGQTQSNSDVAYTSYLKEAPAPLISRRTCSSQSEYGNHLSSNMMCAGYLKGGIDTCQGDSGGPLLCQSDDNDRYYVWGIVSWGNGCARPRAPGVYTIVANYLSWIEEQTGIRI